MSYKLRAASVALTFLFSFFFANAQESLVEDIEELQELQEEQAPPTDEPVQAEETPAEAIPVMLPVEAEEAAVPVEPKEPEVLRVVEPVEPEVQEQKLDSMCMHPKREFRGAWMHTVSNSYYRNLTPEQWRDTISKQLDAYAAAGINAIIFQVRPEADAFYISTIEPWSRYLTGTQGQAPIPLFDPLEFMIEECHKRCMELHAWLNPYRANVNRKNNKLVDWHLYKTQRHRFINYGNQTLFDPALPENREYICRVVKDIVTRYDVDAIHMDDYFYPYPLPGVKFPDDKSFKKYAHADGNNFDNKGDWRRDNVNKLIKQLHDTIKAEKPWVRFGISPFGIYRNLKQDPKGSATNGLSNYDELYADVLLWMNEKWIDYCVPQLYWEIGHRLADYDVLARWWAWADTTDVQLYIGQDVQRTHAQLYDKMLLERALPNVEGNCFWSGAALLENPGGMLDSLKTTYHAHPALIPVYKSDTAQSAPPAPIELKLNMMAKQPMLSWHFEFPDEAENERIMYAVYAFDLNEDIDLENGEKLVAVTRDTKVEIPAYVRPLCSKFVVTAVNRLNIESLPSNVCVYVK